MARRVYVGPVAEILTVLDGAEMIVARGDVVDVSDEQAVSLDSQSENWAKPRTTAQTPKEGDR